MSAPAPAQDQAEVAAAGGNADARHTLIMSEQRQAEHAVLQAKKVHIRVQQRSRKKNVTTIQGLDSRLNFRRICRAMQHLWGCNGTVLVSDHAGTVIQLQGNWSEKIKEWLLNENMVTEENLEIHSL